MKPILAILLLIAVSFSQIAIPMNTRKVKLLDFIPFNAYATQIQSPTPITVNLTNLELMQYYGPIYMSQNPSAFTCVFDTGSAVAWLPSTSCINPHTSHLYSCGTTCNMTNITKTITYVLGYVSGNMTFDNATIETQTISQMGFVNVLVEKDNYGMKSDGLVGLNVASFYDPNNLGIMYYLKNQSLISSNVFGVYLSSIANDANSQIILGGFDTSRNLSLEYSPVTDSNDWEIAVKSYSIGSSNFTGSGMTAIIDTGTSLMMVPNSVYQFYVTKAMSHYGVNNCGLIEGINLFGCIVSSTSDIHGFPEFRVQFQQHSFGVVRNQMVQVYYTDTNQYLAVLMMEVINDNNLLLLGDTFIRGHYLVFNFDNKTIGISAATHTSVAYVLLFAVIAVLI